jgi:hypothetical protein
MGGGFAVFEPVIAPIAFAVILLVIIGVAIAAAVRRRLTRGARGDTAYSTVHPNGWRAADDTRGEEGSPTNGRAGQDRPSTPGSRAVNE